jgi:predicted PurR-regulated permease PerM
VVNWFETLISGAVKRKENESPKRAKLLRFASILLTWALVMLLVYLLMVMLIPQLVESITVLINNAENYYNKVYEWVNGLFSGDSQVGSWLAKIFERYYDNALDFLQGKLLPWAQAMLTKLTGGIWSGIWSVVSFLKNLIIGIIVSVYMLAMKERSAARCCKLLYGTLKEEQAKTIVRATRKVNSIFSGFVRGKLLDSLIIGILCFIGCSILKIPYTPLVSVFVGVTNIIPFFGPVIGAVPSAFLILLVDPLRCLYFVIFVIGLQQLDGNVIGPKILGDSTGISSFWVVVAILVGGGFFGLMGMFLGVPICACLQELVRFLVNRRLKKRDMPLDARTYVTRDKEPAESAPAPEKKE